MWAFSFSGLAVREVACHADRFVSYGFDNHISTHMNMAIRILLDGVDGGLKEH